MRKQQRSAAMNRYAAWKYIILVTSLVIMLLSALPTYFGEDPAVQISHEAGLKVTPLALDNILKNEGVKVKRIDQTKAQTLIVLEDASQQGEVKSLLSEQVSDPALLSLTLTPAAPNWLLSLGFKPIKLGLDLQGGVQFLLDVEVEPVYKLHANALIDSIRQFAREQSLYGVVVQPAAENGVNVVTTEDTQKTAIKQFINKQYPRWRVSNTADQSLRVMLSDAENSIFAI